MVEIYKNIKGFFGDIDKDVLKSDIVELLKGSKNKDISGDVLLNKYLDSGYCKENLTDEIYFICFACEEFFFFFFLIKNYFRRISKNGNRYHCDICVPNIDYCCLCNYLKYV
jgi:hypothetical protein